MDATIVRLGVAGVLAAHGLGHALEWMPAFGTARFEGVSSSSWLLTPLVGATGVRVVAGVLFLVPTVGFVIAAAGLATGQPWWRGLAIGSAAVSLACTGLYPHAFTTGATIGSVAVNILVIVGLLATDWGRVPA